VSLPAPPELVVAQASGNVSLPAPPSSRSAPWNATGRGGIVADGTSLPSPPIRLSDAPLGSVVARTAVERIVALIGTSRRRRKCPQSIGAIAADQYVGTGVALQIVAVSMDRVVAAAAPHEVGTRAP
jgi:hypothetical protein